LSSSLLSRNIKFKIYRTLIFPVVLYGCETWSVTLREERRLRILRFGLRRTREEEGGENYEYLMRNLLVCTTNQVLFG
jgi:hypothetical protein